MYIAYLRSAFHTCYYCAIVTDHLEELQRKCIKHERKPLTKAMLEDLKAAEVAEQERLEKEMSIKVEGEESDVAKVEVDEPVVPPPPAPNFGPLRTENRDWKRNDERWLEWLDSKIALLVDREAVDPREYGGKSYDE